MPELDRRNRQNQDEIFFMIEKIFRDFDYERLRFLKDRIDQANPKLRQCLAELSRKIPQTIDYVIRAGMEDTAFWLYENGHASFTEQSLMFAVIGNCARLVKYLCSLDQVFELETVARGTILHVAIENRNTNILTTLLKRYRRIIDQPNPYGLTPLALACELKDEQSISLLLSHGASLSNSLNQRSLLMYAACSDNTELTQRVINEIKASCEGRFQQNELEGSRRNIDENALLRLFTDASPMTKPAGLLDEFGGLYLDAALRANAKEVVKLFIVEGFDLDVPFSIDNPYRERDREFRSKLAEIILEMSWSDFRPDTLIWLLGKALRVGSGIVASALLTKFIEFCENVVPQGQGLSRLFKTICVEASFMQRTNAQVLAIFSKIFRAERDVTWLNEILINALQGNNFALIVALFEDEECKTSIKPEIFAEILVKALSLEEFATVERIIAGFPLSQRLIALGMLGSHVPKFVDEELDDMVGQTGCRPHMPSLSKPLVLGLRWFRSVKEIEDTIVWLLNFTTHANNEYFKQRLANVRSQALNNKNRANLLLSTNSRGLQLINCFAVRSIMTVNYLLKNADLLHLKANQFLDCVAAVLLNSIEEFLNGRAKPHQIFRFKGTEMEYKLSTLRDTGAKIHRNFMFPLAVWHAMEKHDLTLEELRALNLADVNEMVSITQPYSYFFISTLGDYLYLLRFNHASHRHAEPIELRPLTYTSWPPLAEPVTIGHYKIVCLTNSLELIEEGKALKHCVGSGHYADLCLKGSSCIFSIRTLDDMPVATAQVNLIRNRLREGGEIWWLDQIRGYRDDKPDESILKVWKEFERQVFQGSIKILDTRSAEEVASSIREKFARGVSPLERFIGIPLNDKLDALINEYRRVGPRDDNNVVHSFVPTEDDPNYDLFITTIDKMALEIVKLARSAKARRVKHTHQT